MKRATRRLMLRGDTLRILSAQELGEPRGGFITTILKTVCATCGDSCTTTLDTTLVHPMG